MLVPAVLLLGVLSIAATLWLEMRRDTRRSRLVKTVQSVINDEDVQHPGDTPFKRAA